MYFESPYPRIGQKINGKKIIPTVNPSLLPNGSPVDLIVGPTVGQFTGYVFLGIGYFLTSSSSNSEKEESN